MAARSLKVTFVNGESRRFAFEPENVSDPGAVTRAFNRFVEAAYVLLDMSRKMARSSMSNVLPLEVVPKPEGIFPAATCVL